MMNSGIPKTQRAIQLIGVDELRLKQDKPVHRCGPYQVLAKVEVAGLCFSDLKLLKQFSSHIRKSEIVSGIDLELLKEIPSYVPGDAAVVPGHETVVRIVEVGEKVEGIAPGDRRLVQTDYRWIKTAQSNAAFGYTFEGGLQEYVLMDMRIITDPDGENMLIPASEELSASSIALVEPWACVEDAYVTVDRNTLKKGGNCLVVNMPDDAKDKLRSFLVDQPMSASMHCIDGMPNKLADNSIDDLLFYGTDADLLEKLFDKMAPGGRVILMQCGDTFARDVVTPVGRIHYTALRISGTVGNDPQKALYTPPSAEIRPNDRIDIVGAGGPMGTMHVIRDICQGVPGVNIFAGDMSNERLAALSEVAIPLATTNKVGFETYNAKLNPPADPFDHIAIMVPAPALVAQAIERCTSNAMIDIFAGIPVTVYHPLNLNDIISKQIYMFGTSGSAMSDMRVVLDKVSAGNLNTDLSVAAISGLDGAAEGMKAVEHQQIIGKVVVYPACHGLGLTKLEDLEDSFPTVAAALEKGKWTMAAEDILLRLFRNGGNGND